MLTSDLHSDLPAPKTAFQEITNNDSWKAVWQTARNSNGIIMELCGNRDRVKTWLPYYTHQEGYQEEKFLPPSDSVKTGVLKNLIAFIWQSSDGDARSYLDFLNGINLDHLDKLSKP